ncbi:MAG TPA: TonB-dependent receptor [Pyrinomonadaceae bacterium]|nr:TonB-dependent receptor [Pyrinomonadaceae bacterium]
MRRNIPPTFLSLFLLLLTPFIVVGQSERGALVGVVTDSLGAVVPGATVTIVNLSNNSTVTAKSNDEGLYEAPFLIPATYKVSVGVSGFSTAVINEVVVNVGQRTRLDVTLTAGDVSARLDVVDTPALLQTESASIGQVITDRQLTQLPTQTRNIYGFLLLDSTVNNGPTGNAEAFRIETGGSMSISGTRPSSVTFKTDGAANNDPTFGTPTITPSIDSVKEFQLLNNAYSAEFEGITQVSVATKSGSGRFHGSAFEFLQNDYFQPRNPNGTLDSQGRRSKNKLKYNQFGGTIGGPVWLPRFGEGGPVFFNKDRTFFFFSYEGLRNNARAIAFTRVLTQAERLGDFSSNLGACLAVGGVQVPQLNPNGTPSGQCVRAGQIFDPATTVANPAFNPGIATSALNPQFIRQPFANNQIPFARLNQNALAMIDVQQPLPNFVSASDLNYAAPSGNNFLNNQWSIRLDHKASDNDHIYGRYTSQNNQRDGELVLAYQQKNIVGNGRVLNTTWTHSFSPSMVNELRLGYVRGVYGDSVTEIDPRQFGVRNTSLNTLPRIFLSSGTALNYGGFSASVLQTIQNTYQVADNFSYIRGRHSMKFGFKGDHNRFKNADFINANGTLQFSGLFSIANSSLEANASRPNSIADFLLGQANAQSLAATQPAYLSNTPLAFYFQDDWKLSRRLTLTLGLRYEIHQPFKEASLGGRTVDFENGGHLIVADPEVARLANSPLVVCCTGERVVKTDRNDFAPRLGIAYQPFKNDNTVIRAGWGIFYADTSQFFHWLYYAPLRGTSIFQPRVATFTNPAANLADPFPASQFPPAGSGLTISIPAGVNPAAVNNQPVVNAFGIGSYDTPESQQWSAGIQREIWGNMVLDVSYKGSVAKHLPVQWFFNQPSFSPTTVNFASATAAANPYLRRPYSAFTIGSNIVANVLTSNYNAATVEVEKRFSDGYTFTSTYTWSKSIDQGAEVFTLGQNHAFLPDNHNFDANRGVSAFDVPHRWVTNGIVELPFGKNKRYLNSGGIVDKLVGGWRFSGIFQLQSGLPIQPYVLNRLTNTGISILERGNLALSDPYLSGDAWDEAVRNWHNGARLAFIRPGAIDVNYAPGTGGNIGRNIFRAPYGRRLDLQMAKVTRLGENASLELRLDVFDVTREVLHLTFINGSVTGAAVLNPANVANGTLGTIPGRNIFFRPHTIQLGARFTF